MSLAHPLENKLAKGSYAIAHVQKTMTSLLAGRSVYSRYYIVKITKATREGRAKAFKDCAANCDKTVDRFTTIYTLPPSVNANLPALFDGQELGFTGYQSKAELKSALHV